MRHKHRNIHNSTAKRPLAVRLAFLFCGLLLLVSLVIPYLRGPKGTAPAEEKQSAPVAEAPPPAPTTAVIKDTVKPGDTFAAILGPHISSAGVHSLVQQSAKIYPLSRITAGRNYEIVSEADSFRRFVYDIDSEEQLIIESDGNGYSINRVPIEYEVRTALAQGTITDSLFQAVDEAGEHELLVYRIADIFEYDIDFARSLREGDSFRVLLEKRYLDGTFAGYGRVFAARFDNQGQAFYGVAFSEDGGRPYFYNLEGRSVRKAFLKAPLKFTRISSSFSWRRLHPILHEYKAHPAIDYAAPVGTPVRSVGDGTVTFVGVQGAAGRMITVRHLSGYETMYLHLNGYAKGIRSGAKVSQGQVIGYVGSSGRSTGPHLDFRMKQNGKYINPMSVKTPPALNISKKAMPEFSRIAKKYRGILDLEEPLQAEALPAPDAPGAAQKL